MSIAELDELILRVSDYPKPGIIFQDITPLLANAEGFSSLIEHLAQPFQSDKPTHVLGIEARGFMIAGALAQYLNAGFIPARKIGKLPRETISEKYDLEYGSAEIELHADALPKMSKVLVVDDVLATGGTLAAVLSILSRLQTTVIGISVISEITALNGRAKFPNVRIHSLIQ